MHHTWLGGDAFLRGEPFSTEPRHRLILNITILSHTTDLDDDSYLRQIVRAELPRYQSITAVQVGDGTRTSFWHDRWLLSDMLALAFPALFSHCLHPDLSFAAFCSYGPSSHFRPQLTLAADAERHLLFDCLASLQLRNSPDQWRLDQFQWECHRYS